MYYTYLLNVLTDSVRKLTGRYRFSQVCSQLLIDWFIKMHFSYASSVLNLNTVVIIIDQIMILHCCL